MSQEDVRRTPVSEVVEGDPHAEGDQPQSSHQTSKDEPPHEGSTLLPPEKSSPKPRKSSLARRVPGEGAPSAARTRKISFFGPPPDINEETPLEPISEVVIKDGISDSCREPILQNDHFSSRTSFTSRPSFIAGLTSRPSMVSLKSTISKVNLELYPERGSFIATSIGHSLGEIPGLAKRLYVVTQVLAAVSVSIGSMAVGFSAAYTSTALASMSSENSTLNITTEQASWVGSLMPLSALAGSVIGGYLIDALGRKMLILICGPPFIVALLIIGSAVNVWMLYIGRAIQGCCVGFLSLSLPVYLGETIQAEIRGTLGLLPTTIGGLGILFCFVVGSYINWSWLAYAGAIIPIVFSSLMIFVPETPRWYVSKGKDDKARSSLEWLRGSDNRVDSELEDIIDNYEAASRVTYSVWDLKQKRYMKPFGMAIGLMAFQQLSGINAVIFYTVFIFKASGSTLDGNVCTIIIGIVNLLSTLTANVLIDRLGRKILLYISSVFMILPLFALGGYFYGRDSIVTEDDTDFWYSVISNMSWLPLVSLVLYVIGFSLGWGPIPWLFMGEALPAKIRGTAASLVTAFNWTCTFIITKTFQGLMESLGAASVFFMFAGIMTVGLVFSITMIPETKGKSLEEIEAEIGGVENVARKRRISQMSGIIMH